MKKNLLNKLLAGMLAVSLALPSAMVMPGMETVVQAAGGLSVTGVIGTNIDGGSLINPNPEYGWYLVPGTEDVRLLFEINSDKKSVSLTHNSVHYNWLYDYDKVKDIPFPTLSLEIPAYVDGYPVTQVGSDQIDYMVYKNYALQCVYLTSVTIPDTVLILKDYLFAFRPDLTEVNLPDSITDIGEACFTNSGIKSIVVPKNLKKIKMGTFSDCKALTSVTLPEVLVEIGDCAFDGCKSLYAKFVFRHEAAHFKEVGIYFQVFTDLGESALAVDNDMITSRHKGVCTIARGGFHKCQEIERIFIDHAYLVFTTLPHGAHAAFANLPEYLAIECHETI